MNQVVPMLARGKWVTFGSHAYDGMHGERPPITVNHIEKVLEDPDHDDGSSAFKRIGKRTIIVRYAEDEKEIFVRSVSSTRRHLAP